MTRRVPTPGRLIINLFYFVELEAVTDNQRGAVKKSAKSACTRAFFTHGGTEPVLCAA